MKVTTNLPIQDSYRERGSRTNVISHPNIDIVLAGFHRGISGASSALTRSHIGHPIYDGVTTGMASLDIKVAGNSAATPFGVELVLID
jgi:hypothetical protein